MTPDWAAERATLRRSVATARRPVLPAQRLRGSGRSEGSASRRNREPPTVAPAPRRYRPGAAAPANPGPQSEPFRATVHGRRPAPFPGSQRRGKPAVHKPGDRSGTATAPPRSRSRTAVQRTGANAGGGPARDESAVMADCRHPNRSEREAFWPSARDPASSADAGTGRWAGWPWRNAVFPQPPASQPAHQRPIAGPNCPARCVHRPAAAMAARFPEPRNADREGSTSVRGRFR